MWNYFLKKSSPGTRRIWVVPEPLWIGCGRRQTPACGTAHRSSLQGQEVTEAGGTSEKHTRA